MLAPVPSWLFGFALTDDFALAAIANAEHDLSLTVADKHVQWLVHAAPNKKSHPVRTEVLKPATHSLPQLVVRGYLGIVPSSYWLSSLFPEDCSAD